MGMFFSSVVYGKWNARRISPGTSVAYIN